VASVLYRVVGLGLMLDLTQARPCLSPRSGSPAGSLVIRKPGGEEVVREGLSAQQIGYLLRTALTAFAT